MNVQNKEFYDFSFRFQNCSDSGIFCFSYYFEYETKSPIT